ncbi:ABC transporter permease [Amycolatopsis anabasis]|uniref:ABC transporter permease n=1 Tax=Amycolatopsis anabasis TaxID=1840409 RepID=UPI00131C176C|nr:ABC transporter permease [Amycolatopsis anabasis]
MTTTTLPARTGGGLTGAVHAEWTKFWSVRSTWLSLAAAAVLMIVYAVAVASSIRFGADDAMAPHEIAIGGSFYLSQFAVLAVAALFITGEYASGSIRSTLQWVPVRDRMLLAKGIVLVPVLFVFGLVLAMAGMLIAQPLLGGLGRTTTVPAALLAMTGMGAYFALLGLLALGVGAAVRSTAGAITLVFAILLALPMVFAPLGGEAILGFFPGLAGTNGMVGSGQQNPVFHTPSPYAPWIGLLICAVWSAVSLAAGRMVLTRRDA